ncbi:MAG TPA: hypothetical protein V6D48_20930, partial [Oculatellaceae cyanobacterium]
MLGLLPWADATQYYFDANRLINGSLFTSVSGHRPLYTSLLAVLLKISTQNLQAILVVFVIINALVIFLFVEEIYSEFGAASAIVILYLCHFFYRLFVGTMLTEQFGYPMGLLAFVVFIRAVRTQKLWLFSLGMMILVYALLIRAGTFFVLPILILFAMINFGKNRQYDLKILLIMVVAVAVPVLSNSWLGRVVASPGAVAFANFADTLYGQARGGVKWTQASVDHPELASMTERERSRLLYRLAFEEIKNNPLGLLKGSVKAFTDFILPGPLAAFGFLRFGNRVIDFLLQVSVAVLFLLGLWKIWKSRKNAISMLILVFWAGTFLSIPFLPPIDAGIRPYAATIGSIFLPVCFVFSHTFFRSVGSSQHENPLIPAGIAYSFALILLLFALVGAPFLRITTKPLDMQSIACEPGLIPVNFRLDSRSYISLSSIEALQKTKVPDVLLKDVHRSLDDFPYGDFASVLRKIRQPVLVAAVLDYSTKAGIWIVAPSELKNYENQLISTCAEMVFPKYSV